MYACVWWLLELLSIDMMSKFIQMQISIYALLPNKQRHSYNRAYMLLKDAALDCGLTLDPVSLMCDFELAIFEAVCAENGSNSLLSPIICSSSLAGSTARGSTDPTSRQPCRVLRQHMGQWTVTVQTMELF